MVTVDVDRPSQTARPLYRVQKNLKLTGVSGGPPISPFNSVKLSFNSSNFILHFESLNKNKATLLK